MSTWREFMSWNKYTQIASRALRQALNESERVSAEKRAAIGARVQIWENGQAGEAVRIVFFQRVGLEQAGLDG